MAFIRAPVSRAGLAAVDNRVRRRGLLPFVAARVAESAGIGLPLEGFRLARTRFGPALPFSPACSLKSPAHEDHGQDGEEQDNSAEKDNSVIHAPALAHPPSLPAGPAAPIPFARVQSTAQAPRL